MDEDTIRLLGEGLLVVIPLCFIGGAAMLVLRSPVDIPIFALGALGLIFVGVGASMKNRTRPPD